MNKVFCDIHKDREIKTPVDAGGVYFFENQKLVITKDVTERMVKKEYELCPECIAKIKKLLGI